MALRATAVTALLIPDFLRLSEGERLVALERLPVVEQTLLVTALSRSVRDRLVEKLPQPLLVGILRHLDPDEVVDLIACLPKRKQKQLLGELTQEIQAQVAFLSKFDAQTAAGLMHLNYLQIPESTTVREVIERVRAHEERTGRTPVILVMRAQRVRGELPFSRLVGASPTNTIERSVQVIDTVEATTSLRDLTKLFRLHDRRKAVVLGADRAVLGVIFADDVLRAIGEERHAGLYAFAGVREAEGVLDRTAQKVHFRAKWLLVNLATAFLASAVVGLFRGVLETEVLLAVFLPIVAGMGGNSATQTLAVMVRGLTLDEVKAKNVWMVAKREIGAGFINGLLNGAVICAVIGVWYQAWLIGAILGLAMVINLMIAGFFGTMIPMLMKVLKKDPAASATVFITTATDIFGFLAFLGLASWLL